MYRHGVRPQALIREHASAIHERRHLPAFVHLTDHFRHSALPAPIVMAWELGHGYSHVLPLATLARPLIQGPSTRSMHYWRTRERPIRGCSRIELPLRAARSRSKGRQIIRSSDFLAKC